MCPSRRETARPRPLRRRAEATRPAVLLVAILPWGGFPAAAAAAAEAETSGRLLDMLVRSFTFELQRYLLFAVGIWAALWLLAPLVRRRKIRPNSPPPRQLLMELAASLRTIVVFAFVGLAVWVAIQRGWLPLPALGARWGPIWFVTSLIATILAHDAYFYWVHRAMHHPRLFRRFHRRHHRSHNPSPFAAYSFDIGEAMLMAAFVPIWAAIFPAPMGALLIFSLHQIARNTLGHSGYELMPGRRCGRPHLDWMTTTTHHDLHHAHAGYNYGFYFTWWDRWMGTEHPEYHRRYAEAAGVATRGTFNQAESRQSGGARPGPAPAVDRRPRI